MKPAFTTLLSFLLLKPLLLKPLLTTLLPLPPPRPCPPLQRHIDDAAVELADANARYQQLKQQLQDEQVQRALLQRQADEVTAAARAERVEAQARYQELLAQLTAERDQREALQVCAVLGWAVLGWAGGGQ